MSWSDRRCQFLVIVCVYIYKLQSNKFYVELREIKNKQKQIRESID